MAGSRKPGPLGLTQEVDDLNDGTMIRALSPRPGSIDVLAIFKRQAERGDKVRLKALFAAVKATSVGKKFLSFAKGEPNLVWGDTGDHHGYFDDNKTITLNEDEKNQLNDCEWQQVIAMELGNFANKAPIRSVFDDCLEGNLSKVDYVRAIVKIEFDSRNLVIDAHENGEFGNCPLIFKGRRMSFEDYIKDARGATDRANYENKWEQNCKKAYLRKHPTK